MVSGCFSAHRSKGALHEAVVFLFFSRFFCGPAVVAAQAPPAASADQADAVKGSNAFAVDLYGRLSAQPGNLFFSPESVSTAFAMTYAGARGQTATEMARVFTTRCRRSVCTPPSAHCCLA